MHVVVDRNDAQHLAHGHFAQCWVQTGNGQPISVQVPKESEGFLLSRIEVGQDQP